MTISLHSIPFRAVMVFSVHQQGTPQLKAFKNSITEKAAQFKGNVHEWRQRANVINQAAVE